MNRTTLKIVFDRGERVYSAGEVVRGRVLVRVSSRDRCRGVNLVYFWRTHGKGDTDRSEPRPVRLHVGGLEFDRTHELPFEFRAPSSPFTYHGRLLNVDHYVEASLELRWAADPYAREKFLLIPGPGMDVPEMLHHPLALAPKGGVGKVAFVGAGLTFLGIISATPFLLIGGGIVFLFGLRRPMARFRMGQVVVHLDSRVLVPDEPFEVALVVRPRHDLVVKGASAVLRARENCVSGSGKNRTKHGHVIFRQGTPLSGPATFNANKKTELRASVPVPDAGAYTFRSAHNRVVWDLTFHVDIPAWPDWQERKELHFWPAVPESLPDPRPDRRIGGGSREPASLDVAEPEEHVVEEDPPMEDSVQEPVAPEPESAPVVVEAGPVVEPEAPDESEGTPLMVAVQAILKENRFGTGRATLIEQLIGQTYTFDLTVERVERTFGSLEPEYRGGQTVQGSIAGSRIPLSVRFPAAYGDELGRPARGARIRVRGTVVEWQDLHDRPTIEANGGDDPGSND